MPGVRPHKRKRHKTAKRRGDRGHRRNPPWVYAVVILMVLIMIAAVASKASFG